MTESEGELLWKLGNEFYHEYGKLVAQFISKVPIELRGEMEYKLQELSNLFSSCYPQELAKIEASNCKCGALGTPEMHPCPYAEEINDNHKNGCNCCAKCCNECMLEI